MVGDSQQFDTAALKIETEKLKKRIVEEAKDPPKKRAKVDAKVCRRLIQVYLFIANHRRKGIPV